jgi:short-subunit dehydrogenase involved in D-alanine esterification of teichoic acids
MSTNNIKTVLIIGATSGLGEQFARRFHALGKKVVITGRRADRLSSLKSELGFNVESYQWDITDFENLASHASKILTTHPDINSVFIVSGVMESFNFLDTSTSTESSIINECNTNLTAQMLLTRVFIPYLSSVAAKGEPATFLLTSSGLAFVPLGFFPVYVGAKAGIHALALALRMQISQSPDKNVKDNFHIVEVAPPYVDTDIDAHFRNSAYPPPMPLKEFMDAAMDELAEKDENGKPLKEIAVGAAKLRVELWRGSIGKYMNQIGLQC